MRFKPKFYSFLRWLLSPFFRIIFRVKYINAHNLPKKGAYILVSNHISGVDPIIIAVGQKHRYIHYMGKSELFKNKFLNWFFRSIGCFPVDRGKSDTTSVRHFEQVVNDGHIMGIFFEGTRSKTGEFLKPKSGAALIAYDTNTPIIPVCVTKINKKYVCHFGDIVTLDKLGFEHGGAKEFREATRRIMEIIKGYREQDINEYHSS